MNKSFIISIIAIILLFEGCSKDDEGINSPVLSPPILTGFELLDEFGVQFGQIGYPNTRVTNEDVTHSGHLPLHPNISCYPNPVSDRLAVRIYIENEGRQKVFITIVEGIFSSDNEEPILSNMVISEFSSGSLKESEYEMYSGIHTTVLSLGDLPDGYYRIYVKVGDELFWDNLIIAKEFIYY